MWNYELLSKLRNLTLVGTDEEGELEFVGTPENWKESELDEIDLINN